MPGSVSVACSSDNSAAMVRNRLKMSADVGEEAKEAVAQHHIRKHQEGTTPTTDTDNQGSGMNGVRAQIGADAALFHNRQRVQGARRRAAARQDHSPFQP